MTRRRFVALLAAGTGGMIATIELGVRWVAGDHLLYAADPGIEYLPQPDQAVMQDGVDIRTNAWGMRSDPATEAKPDDAFRVLVLGDSVVFGYTNIAHADLATTLLSGMNVEDEQRIEALNASASSWGPGNMLAWLDRFGTMDADAIVVVLSTHDIDDDRTFSPPERDAFPQARPISALADRIWRSLTPDPAEGAPADPRSEGDARRSLPVLLQQVAAAPSSGCLIIHVTSDERKDPAPTNGELQLGALGREAGLSVIMGRDFIDGGEEYIDGIHLSPEGQRDLARAMAACPALPLRT